jgi:hypothetical protein
MVRLGFRLMGMGEEMRLAVVSAPDAGRPAASHDCEPSAFHGSHPGVRGLAVKSRPAPSQAAVLRPPSACPHGTQEVLNQNRHLMSLV